MVARRAGMGPDLAACSLVRHRLGPVAVSGTRRRAAAHHRLVLWRGVGKGRHRTSLRSRRRQLFGLVFRTSPADRAGALQRDLARRRQGGRRRGRCGGGKHCSIWRRATRDCAIPIAARRRRSRQSSRPSRKAAISSRAGFRPTGQAPVAPRPITALHHLLERQHYKLGHWRLASSDINYRRFFDVNTLAGLRVEDAGTFDAIHRLVRKLIAEDRLQGLRLDHIDGLRDPAQYFQRLRRLIREAQGTTTRPFYMVIEKILGEHEELPCVQWRARHHRL